VVSFRQNLDIKRTADWKTPQRSLIPLGNTLTPQVLHLIVLVATLLLALRLKLILHPTAVMVILCSLAIAMGRVEYLRAELPAIRLLQLVGSLSALYSLLHYPLMPVMPTAEAEAAYLAILFGWAGSTICGILCFRFASLGLIPATFLVWSKGIAGHVTGLPHAHTLDVLPLSEVAACIGIGLAISTAYNKFTRTSRTETRNQFATLILVFAICIHLANYFWSAIAKIKLDGAPLAWVTFNNPLYIYLAALDLDHIVFSERSFATWLGELIDRTHVLSNVVLLFAQGVAILGFLMPKRLLLLLLIVFDFMHISIALAAGANFWPWIFLNIAISAVIVAPEYRQPGWRVGLAAAVFVLAAPQLAMIARLGWYDASANNKRFFEAEDNTGQRYYVSSNFFTFYSYPIAHWDYGVPDSKTAFVTGMNGSTESFEVAKASRACDLQVLTQPNSQSPPSAELSQFIINYHRMAEAIESNTGVFPYNVYPHHFYVRPALNRSFDSVDKHNIRAYIFKRESSCLSWRDGKLHRGVISTGEFRINLPHD
jgi:hypothetical protein